MKVFLPPQKPTLLNSNQFHNPNPIRLLYKESYALLCYMVELIKLTLGKQNNTVKFSSVNRGFLAVPVFQGVPECSGGPEYSGVPGCSGAPLFLVLVHAVSM